MHLSFVSEHCHNYLQIMLFSLSKWGAQINEAYDQSFPKRNTKTCANWQKSFCQASWQKDWIQALVIMKHKSFVKGCWFLTGKTQPSTRVNGYFVEFVFVNPHAVSLVGTGLLGVPVWGPGGATAGAGLQTDPPAAELSGAVGSLAGGCGLAGLKAVPV